MWSFTDFCFLPNATKATPYVGELPLKNSFPITKMHDYLIFSINPTEDSFLEISFKAPSLRMTEFAHVEGFQIIHPVHSLRRYTHHP